MQTGWPKFQCFICEWDSCDHKNHFVQKLWRTRDSCTIGEKNVINELLVPKKIILLPLHIKLELMTVWKGAKKKRVLQLPCSKRNFRKYLLPKLLLGSSLGHKFVNALRIPISNEIFLTMKLLRGNHSGVLSKASLEGRKSSIERDNREAAECLLLPITVGHLCEKSGLKTRVRNKKSRTASTFSSEVFSFSHMTCIQFYAFAHMRSISFNFHVISLVE